MYFIIYQCTLLYIPDGSLSLDNSVANAFNTRSKLFII